ncbi:germination protein YpeB [Clostridium algifaecis]|uniref:Germination protein YpeB n=1 Tax=Clostridium algifaecis TaxID=1472040 RepID=A0ABS4KQR5_9CLOT|nr:germination protein YpeB [Clostridium algifaecis]MBP2032367.1 germination protein YpeB [Clostridium algifaecis]
MRTFKKSIIYTAIVILIIVFSSTFAVLMTLERNDYRNYLQAEYGKSMYELIDAVKNIRVNLAKAEVVGSREQGIVVFEEIFRYSAIAGDKLHSLPVSQQDISNTSKFLSQVGDFCYNLGSSSSKGVQLTDKDYSNMERLKKESINLEDELSNASNNINQGKVKWGEIRKKVTGVLARNDADSAESEFKNIQKQVVQYPALIYDGPFSDNTLEINPKVNSKKEVSQKQAEKVARKTIGNNKISNLKTENLTEKGNIKVYRFTANLKSNNGKKENAICEVSKNGGNILYLINDRVINNSSINMDKAVDTGEKYLIDLGYKGMVPTYTLRYGNEAVISYVYKQNNIIMYPDQIKLKVALDNGEVVGVESEKYLVAHEDSRNIEQPKISLSAAKQRVGKRLRIIGEKLVIIPTENNKEVLCYEFSGNYNEDKFKVYINAYTGYEERIIQIINTPNGQLTM